MQSARMPGALKGEAMLIEIVQHEANKVVKEATMEQALEYARQFPVNLLDAEGNRTPLKVDDELALPADQATDAPAEESPEAVAEAPAEEAAPADAPTEG